MLGGMGEETGVGGRVRESVFYDVKGASEFSLY